MPRQNGLWQSIGERLPLMIIWQNKWMFLSWSDGRIIIKIALLWKSPGDGFQGLLHHPHHHLQTARQSLMLDCADGGIEGRKNRKEHKQVAGRLALCVSRLFNINPWWSAHLRVENRHPVYSAYLCVNPLKYEPSQAVDCYDYVLPTEELFAIKLWILWSLSFFSCPRLWWSKSFFLFQFLIN